MLMWSSATILKFSALFRYLLNISVDVATLFGVFGMVSGALNIPGPRCSGGGNNVSSKQGVSVWKLHTLYWQYGRIIHVQELIISALIAVKYVHTCNVEAAIYNVLSILN